MSDIITCASLHEACLLTEIHREHRSAQGFLAELADQVESDRKRQYLSGYDAQWLTTKVARIQGKSDRIDTLLEVARWGGIDKDRINRALGSESLVFVAPKVDAS